MDHWDPRFPLPLLRGGRNRAYQLSRTNKELLAELPAKADQLDQPSGADRVRTDDLRLARAALSQLSYSPDTWTEAWTRAPGAMVGLGRFELPTSRLSGVRSNQLSYRPRADDADSLETR